MSSFEICTFEDYVAEVTAQPGSLEEAASTQEILSQQIEGYLSRMRQAMCNDVQNLEAQIIAGGGGGGAALPDVPADTEVASGRKLLGSDSFFKIITLGAMPNATTKTVAHGIGAPFTLITQFGSTQNPTTDDQRPLPFVSHSNVTNQILIIVDATNVIIINQWNASAWTNSWLSVEYIKV
jgi:hypothetical protein